MFRHKPKFNYNGLTIIMSNPSRFDKRQLIEGVASFYFEQKCLGPETTRYHCDIREASDESSLLPNTKCILALGPKAHNKLSPQQTTLDENRGSPYFWNNIPVIASFAPQDAMDRVDYEARFNSANLDDEEFDSDEIDAGDIYESKGRGRTARSNYRFWLRKDTKKAITIVNNGGVLPKLYEREPTYHLYPEPDLICDRLDSINNQHLYYDCETDFISLVKRCFAFSSESDPYNIYCIPFLDTNYKPYYGEEDNTRIYWSLANAIWRNILVAHNGAHFDFVLLALLYKIAIKKAYCTMIAQHRIYPTVEKSLGHCVSLATFEGYHKNLGVHGYHSKAQADQLYKYCGMDVFTMYLVHKWQQERMAKDPGLKASIELAMDCIEPYITMTLMGMPFDEEKRTNWIRNSDKRMETYMQFIQMLTGPEVSPLISNKACVKYFHDQLGYKPVARTPANKPSLKAEALYKLGLDHENPVIKLLISYREMQKESSTLNFKVWKK